MKTIRSSKQRMRTLAVCVTDQRTCERIIHAGAKLARENGYALRVVSIQSAPWMNTEQCDALEYLFSVSIDAQAEMTVLYARDYPTALRRCLERMSPAHILVGEPDGRSEVIASLRDTFTNIPITMVNTEGCLHSLPMLQRGKSGFTSATCAAY